MGMKINGIPAAFNLPNVNKKAYRYAKFETYMQATVNGTVKKVDVKNVLEAGWKGIVQRSMHPVCNECFRQLIRKKSLAEILAEGDLTLHVLEPKPGFTDADLPDANAAGRDIGIHPWLLFDPDPVALTCTLVHELAHVGGASTNSGETPEIAHAAERTLLMCSCKSQYRKEVMGSIQIMRSTGVGGSRYA
jgi:hypothetical protein